jgi:hypothetical protein
MSMSEDGRAAVFLGTVAVAGCGVLVWMAPGSANDLKVAVGAGAVAVLTNVVGWQCGRRIGRVLSARRGERRAELRREAEAVRGAEEALTGWWCSPEGDLALVRYDPVISRFLVDGRIWPRESAVREYIRDLEVLGWRPLGDDATSTVRAQLGVTDR